MDISDTIKTKSDQLNADDLIHPVTVKVLAVNKVAGDQPLSITLEGDYQPFKPCKTVRRLLAIAWGVYASEWVGKEMTLYNDPNVMYAGVKVGGIRISHMSDIPKEGISKPLSVSKGKRKLYTVQRLEPTIKPKPASKQAVNDRLPKAIEMVKAGKITKDTAIRELEKNGDKLTQEQLAGFDE